jgi:hypothetical protein
MGDELSNSFGKSYVSAGNCENKNSDSIYLIIKRLHF